MREVQRALRPRLLRFPVDAVPASPSLAKQVGTMEPRDDVDAVTGPADATTALQGARATTIDLAPTVTTLTTPVSSHSVRQVCPTLGGRCNSAEPDRFTKSIGPS